MNEEQVAFWNGPAGDRWAANQLVLDRAIAAYGHAAIERAAPHAGEHALDIGCGCGATALDLADRVAPNGTVLGVDISGPMLARCRERAQSRPNLTVLQGDASSLAFPRTFDLLFSRFGVMFFEDPTAAFRHLRAAVQDGGRLAFVCWRAFDENPWAKVPFEAVGTVAEETEARSPDLPGPYAFADATKVERILASAGFQSIELERFDADVVLAGDDLDEAVQFAVSSGPASRLLLSASADVIARAKEVVRRALEPARTSQGFALPGSSWLVTARA